MSLQAQRQIRENVSETQDFWRDLHQWQKDVKARDTALRRHRSLPKSSEFELSTAFGHAPMHGRTAERTYASKKQAEQYRLRGNDAFREGNYGRAVALYSESLQVHRTCASYANRAMAFLKREQYSEAEADCTRALEMDPGHLKAYQRRSVARKEQGKQEAALEDAEMALRLEPTSDVIRATFHEMLHEALRSEQLGMPRQRRLIPIDHLFPSTPKLQKPSLETQSEFQVPKDPSGRRLGEAVDGEASVRCGEVKPRVPVAPKTWAEFEAAFKSLRHLPELFRSYLGSMDPSRLGSLFKSALSAPILATILEAVLCGLAEETTEVDWKSWAKALPAVARYEMLLMCLNSAQKTRLRELTRLLSQETCRELPSFLKPFL